MAAEAELELDDLLSGPGTDPDDSEAEDEKILEKHRTFKELEDLKEALRNPIPSVTGLPKGSGMRRRVKVSF